MSEIYGLFDADGGLRYIGKANNAANRLKGHMRECRRRNTPLYAWLRKHGVPGMRVLEIADDWRSAERRLIAEARARGAKLLNIANGGDEPFCSTEVRAANGAKNAKAIHSNPDRRRIWLLKQAMGSALKNGRVSNKTRQKLRDLAAIDPVQFGAWADLPDRQENANGEAI